MVRGQLCDTGARTGVRRVSHTKKREKKEEREKKERKSPLQKVAGGHAALPFSCHFLVIALILIVFDSGIVSLSCHDKSDRHGPHHDTIHNLWKHGSFSKRELVQVLQSRAILN